MRKEIVAAIIAGSLLGLVIAFGVWRANLAFSPKKEEENTTPEEQTQPQVDLVVASPEAGVVLTSSPTKVSGVTKPGNFVAVAGEENDDIVKADEAGAFEAEVKLVGGLNEIVVVSFDKDDGQKSTSVTVAYSTQFSSDKTQEEENTATQEADVIREKVQQKATEAANKPIFYMGAVTDITEMAIQMKDASGEIKQVSVSKDTDFVKVTTETKDATFEDTAIGDFVIAMGYNDGNDVLGAKRVIITTQPSKTTRMAAIGKVTQISGKKVIVESPDQTRTLEFGKSWVGPEISELEEGMQVIAAGESKDQTLTVRTLFTIPEATPEATPAEKEASPSPTSTPEGE